MSRVLVTGGGGFLGSHLVERLEAEGHDVFVARRRDYDLTRYDDAERLFADAQPELVFHLAAEVGGIGANRANPGRYWYANLMMGAHVLELSRIHEVREARRRRNGLRLPEVHAGAVPARTTSGTATPRRRTRRTASRRSRSSSARRPTASSTALDAIYLLPANLYGPRDNFDLDDARTSSRR